MNALIMSVRKEVAEFAALMEEKLRENDHKGHWGNCGEGWLLRRLGQELGELRRRMDRFRRADHANGAAMVQEIRRECADVANFAMMIADVMAEFERDNTLTLETTDTEHAPKRKERVDSK